MPRNGDSGSIGSLSTRTSAAAAARITWSGLTGSWALIPAAPSRGAAIWRSKSRSPTVPMSWKRRSSGVLTPATGLELASELRTKAGSRPERPAQPSSPNTGGDARRRHHEIAAPADAEIDYGVTIVNTVGRGYHAVAHAAAVPVGPAGCAGAPDASAGAGRGHRGVPRSWVRGRHHPGDRGPGDGVGHDGGGAGRHQGPAAEGGDRCGDRRR